MIYATIDPNGTGQCALQLDGDARTLAKDAALLLRIIYSGLATTGTGDEKKFQATFERIERKGEVWNASPRVKNGVFRDTPDIPVQ